MPHFSLFLDGVEIERLSLIDRVEFSFLIRKIRKKLIYTILINIILTQCPIYYWDIYGTVEVMIMKSHLNSKIEWSKVTKHLQKMIFNTIYASKRHLATCNFPSSKDKCL